MLYPSNAWLAFKRSHTSYADFICKIKSAICSDIIARERKKTICMHINVTARDSHLFNSTYNALEEQEINA